MKLTRLRLLVEGLRFAVCGLRFAVCGLRFAVCGLRFAVCGLWFAVCSRAYCVHLVSINQVNLRRAGHVPPQSRIVLLRVGERGWVKYEAKCGSSAECGAARACRPLQLPSMCTGTPVMCCSGQGLR